MNIEKQIIDCFDNFHDLTGVVDRIEIKETIIIVNTSRKMTDIDLDRIERYLPKYSINSGEVRDLDSGLIIYIRQGSLKWILD